MKEPIVTSMLVDFFSLGLGLPKETATKERFIFIEDSSKVIDDDDDHEGNNNEDQVPNGIWYLSVDRI